MNSVCFFLENPSPNSVISSSNYIIKSGLYYYEKWGIMNSSSSLLLFTFFLSYQLQSSCRSANFISNLHH